MTKSEFRALCNKYQEGAYSDGFDAQGLVDELERLEEGYWDDLNSHESVKDWFKYCIEEEWNIGPMITAWYKEGFADYYKIDFSMGNCGNIIALATANDFYDAFEDRFNED